MNKKLLLTLGALALSLGGLAGCGGSGGSSAGGSSTVPSSVTPGTHAYKLKIAYYPGGYGSDYVHKLVKGFLAKKNGCSEAEIVEGDIDKGADYTLVSDENISYSCDNYLKVDSKVVDIILSQYISKDHISEGLVEPLNDVYEQNVTTSKGEVKLSDYVFKEAASYYKMKAKPSAKTEYYFSVPWSCIPLSIAYNETMLREVPHLAESGNVSADNLSGGKWYLPPDTCEELLTYFADLQSYNPNIIKFGWSGGSCNWFESLLTVWWAQKQGLTTSNYSGEGTFYDFWQFLSPYVWGQTGIQEALAQLQKIIVKDGAFVNSFQDPIAKDFRAAQSDFAKGEIAMCLTGDFFAKEYQSVMKEGNVFKIMQVPSVDGYTENKKMCFCDINAVAYVPAKSKRKDVAKEFLRYCYNEEQVLTYSQMTGGVKPCNANVLELSGPDYKWNDYTKSAFEMFYNRDVLLTKYPSSAEKVSDVYMFEKFRDSFFYGLEYGDMLSGLKTCTPKEIMVDGNKDKGMTGCVIAAKRDYDAIYKARYNLNY